MNEKLKFLRKCDDKTKKSGEGTIPRGLDRWKHSRENLVRQHNTDKAKLLHELRCLRRVQDGRTHQGISFELESERKVTSSVEDVIVEKTIELERILVRQPK